MTISRREIFAFGALLLLPGCSGERQAPLDALAFVAGGRANSAPPDLVEEISLMVLEALARDTMCSMIVADGQPSVTDRFRLRSTAQNPLTVQREQRAAVERVGAAIRGVRAVVPEVDQLAALTLAARAVSSARGLRRIVMLDSGLQTTGALRFQDDAGAALAAVPEDLAKQLAEDRHIPDLRGVEVNLVGLGDVAEPQDVIGEPGRQALVEAWSAIVRRGGGTAHIVETPIPARAVPAGLPPVSIVPVLPAPPPDRLNEPVTLGDASVGFLPDVADLRNPPAARAMLSPYAARVSKSRQRILLTGTTSSAGTQQGRLDLSLARARVVRDLLVAGGVHADQIEVRGVGSDFPDFVPDRDASGELDPIQAARNRLVIIEPL